MHIWSENRCANALCHTECTSTIYASCLSALSHIGTALDSLPSEFTYMHVKVHSGQCTTIYNICDEG